MKDNYAFPHVTPMGDKAPGMELRDWFAGMAMQGYLAAQKGWVDPDRIAKIAYAYADAMIEERDARA